MRLQKQKYLAILEEKKREGDRCPTVTTIPSKKKGRPLSLGELDKDVQSYIRALQVTGAPIGSAIIIAAAKGIVMSNDPTQLVENGGHIALTKSWSHSLMLQMGLVKRKASTKKSVMTAEQFKQRKEKFLKEVGSFVNCHKVPSSLVINWDQSGIHVIPSCNYTMASKGAKRVEIAGFGDKRQITGTFAATLSGEFLPMQLIYGGKTNRCHPKYKFPEGFDVCHTPNHWANEECALSLLNNIIIPYVNATRIKLDKPDQKALVLYDVFKGQTTDRVHQLLEENNILYVHVPNCCTDQLQPLDASVNKSVKSFLREKFSIWYGEQVKKQLDSGKPASEVVVDMKLSVVKEASANWIEQAYDYMKTSESIIINGFKKSGIFDAIANPVAPSDPQEDPFADLD